MGFTVFDDEVSTWRLSVGASQVMEDYTSGNNSFTGAQAESNYSRKLSNKLSVDHTFLYVPNVSDEIDIRITTEATVPKPAVK